MQQSLTAPADAEGSAPRAPFSRLRLGQIALIIGAICLFWTISSVVLLIFFSVLLAASLRGAGDAVSHYTRLPIGLALSGVVVVVFGALGGLLYWSGPNLYAELNELATRAVSEAEQLRTRLQGSGSTGVIPDAAGLRSMAEQVIAPAAKIFTFSLSTLAELAVALVTALYFAYSPTTYVDGLVRLLPKAKRARMEDVIQAVAHVLRMWVAGQLIDMVAVGVLSAAGLWFAGVPAPFALGVVSGLFTFVPYVGTIVSGVLAVLIALSVGPTTALWALVVFVVCHLVEGYIVAPLIQRRILELPPALTVLSMTVLGSLFGLPGIILGTPLAASMLVLVQALYVGDVLGDHDLDPTRKG